MLALRPIRSLYFSHNLRRSAPPPPSHARPVHVLFFHARVLVWTACCRALTEHAVTAVDGFVQVTLPDHAHAHAVIKRNAVSSYSGQDLRPGDTSRELSRAVFSLMSTDFRITHAATMIQRKFRERSRARAQSRLSGMERKGMVHTSNPLARDLSARVGKEKSLEIRPSKLTQLTGEGAHARGRIRSKPSSQP